MDDLTQARIEFALLEAKAEELFKQLTEVRTALSAQWIKIASLVRKRPPPIHRLPTELLVSILHLDISAHSFHERKWQLAMVSRRWRDVILDNPIFWTTINLLTMSPSAIKTHLKRSGKSLLDIVIEIDGPPSSHSARLGSSMHIVMPHVYRWRTLDVFETGTYYNSDDDPLAVVELLEEAFYGLEFPSLKRAIIACSLSTAYPSFLSPTRAPLVEELALNNCRPWKDFAPPSTLKTLELAFESIIDPVHYPTFPYLIPTQTLTTLSLSGVIDDWSLQPNSFQFPVLKTLILWVSRTKELLQAIVAPNLEHFEYRSEYPDDLPSVVFDGLGPKFARVHRVSFFNFNTARRLLDHDHSALPLCEAFPNMRHVELSLQDLAGLFVPVSPYMVESTHSQYLIDLWKNLQSLTLHRPSDDWVKRHDQLSGWLMQRQKSSLPLLRIKLTDLGHFGSRVNLVEYFLYLHKCLQGYCLLECDIPTSVEKYLSDCRVLG